MEMELNAEEQKKEAARQQFQDFVRRLSVALGADVVDSSSITPEALVHKASELVQVLINSSSWTLVKIFITRKHQD